MFERFTDRARRVLVLAQEEAHRLNHPFIGTEHILLGLILERDGPAARALNSLGITLEAARGRVEETVGTRGATPSGSPPFTPRAKKALELSLREALQLGHSYIGTEHMLLGIVREGDGVGAQVLVSLGADLDRVRQTVTQMMLGHQELGNVDVHSRQSMAYGPAASAENLLLKLLWTSGMIREPQNEAEQSIWNELADRFGPGTEDVTVTSGVADDSEQGLVPGDADGDP